MSETLLYTLVDRLTNLGVVGSMVVVSRFEGRIVLTAHSCSTPPSSVPPRVSDVGIDLPYIFELGRLSCLRITRMMPLTFLSVSTLHCEEGVSSTIWVQTDAALGQRLPTLRDGVSNPDFCLFGCP
jgi:hypothetical protein